MIEAWWRSLKHQWLFLHPLDSVATIRRLVAFYVHEHNHVLPHSAFRGQTPDEMYFGIGDAVPADLRARAADARRARVAANRSAAAKRARYSTPPHDPACRRLLRSRTRAPRGNPLERTAGVPGEPKAVSPRRSPSALDGENSRTEVQNVREESSAERRDELNPM